MHTTIVSKRSLQEKSGKTDGGKPFHGDLTFALDLAGRDFRFSGLTEYQLNKLERRFGHRTGTSRRNIPAVRTTVSYAEIAGKPPENYAVNNIYTPLCRYTSTGLDIEGLGFRAEITLEPEVSGTLRAEDGNLLAEPIIFENYLRMLAAYTTLYQGGIFLHSAAVIMENKAYLFIGRSGAGKSTLSRLALQSGYTILSDDANILLPDAGKGYRAEPVPFAGELGAERNRSGSSYAVAGIYWLEKDTATRVDSLDPALQSAKMLACCPVVNMDPYRIDRALTVILSLAQTAGLQVLRFNHHEKFSRIAETLKENIHAGQ